MTTVESKKYYDCEDLNDWSKMIQNEGDRHFVRNMEESGYTKNDIEEILKEIQEAQEWEEDEED